MLDQTKAVANTLSPQKDCIEEVRVGIAAVIESLACVKDEWQVEAERLDSCSHFKELRNPMFEW